MQLREINLLTNSVFDTIEDVRRTVSFTVENTSITISDTCDENHPHITLIGDVIVAAITPIYEDDIDN